MSGAAASRVARPGVADYASDQRHAADVLPAIVVHNLDHAGYRLSFASSLARRFAIFSLRDALA